MTNQESTTILIKDGLSKATATGVFPTFALKYFVPIYDYRIDTGVHSNIGDTSHPLTNAIPTSASVSSSAVLTPVLPANIEGDILWQNTTEDYRLYEVGDVFYAASAETPNSNVLATTMSSKFDRISIIQNGGLNYTPQKSDVNAWVGAGEITQTSTDGSWEASGGWTQFQQYPTLTSTTWDKNLLMDEIVYAGRNGTTGTYNITIPDSYGSNKINKVLIFIQKVNSDGTDFVSSPPVPFAMVCMKDPIHIYSTTDTANSNSVSGANFRVGIEFTASNTEVTYTPGDPFFNLAASPMTPSTQEPVKPIAFKGDVLLGPGDGGTAIGSPAAKLDLLRYDGKVLHMGTQDITADPGHFVTVANDGISIYDDAAQTAGSETSVWFSKTKPTTSLKGTVGKFESGFGIGKVDYSLVNAIHTGTTSATEITDSLVVGSTHIIDDSQQAVAVGNALTVNELKSSVITAKKLDAQNIYGSVITGERASGIVTAAGDITGSFIHLGSITSGTNLNTVDRCILIGTQNTYGSNINNAFVSGSGNTMSITGYAVGGSFIHGDSNTVNTSNTYVMGDNNKSYSLSIHNIQNSYIHINGHRNIIAYDSGGTTAGLDQYNRFVSVYGDGAWVRNSRTTYILGGDEITSEPNSNSNKNNVQFSNRAHIVGNNNKIKNASNSFTIGVLNSIDLNDNIPAGDTFQNNTLLGISNTISAAGEGDPTDMNVTGSMFVGYGNEMIAGTGFELNFAYTTQVGSFNEINVADDDGTKTTSPSSNISIYGSYNKIPHNQFNTITKLTMVGTENRLVQNATNSLLPAAGTLSEVFIGGVKTSAYFEAHATQVDIALKKLNNISMFGTLGYADATYLNMAFKRYWDENLAVPSLLTGIGAQVGAPRTVIMNGVDGTDHGVGMAFGYTDLGVTNGLRQQIILPLGGTTAVNAEWSNVLNKTKPEFGIPTVGELNTLAASNKNLARGTLCWEPSSSQYSVQYNTSATTPIAALVFQSTDDFAFNVVVKDDDSNYSSGVFTAPAAGDYLFNVSTTINITGGTLNNRSTFVLSLKKTLAPFDEVAKGVLGLTHKASNVVRTGQLHINKVVTLTAGETLKFTLRYDGQAATLASVGVEGTTDVGTSLSISKVSSHDASTSNLKLWNPSA